MSIDDALSTGHQIWHDETVRVEQFDSSFATAVASWPTSVDESQAWCSLDEVSDEIVIDWALADDVQAIVGLVDDQLVAYGELWVDDDEHEVELAHIIVASTARGSGAGRAFVRCLIAEAHAVHPLAVLRVVPGNAAARACYLAAGMHRATEAEEAEWNLSQPIPYVWMSARRPAEELSR